MPFSLKKKDLLLSKILFSFPSSRYIWSDHRTKKKNLRDAAVLFEIKYLLIRFVCAFSLFVCVFFYWSAPGDLSKDDYHKNKHTLPSPTLLCFLPQNSPKQNKYENINPICSFRSESDFWGNLYGFWRLLFIFTSFGVVWVCSLLSDFYFYHILSVLGLNTVLTNLAFENRKLHMLSVTDDANLTHNFVRNTNTQTLIYTKSKAVSFNYIDKLVSYPYIHK